MYTQAQEAVMNYARQAFSVVLDQHELTIQPAHVQAIPLENGDITLIHETLEITASGRFTGDTQAGALTLERVKTTAWSGQFNTVDRFKGVQGDGTPILLPPDR